MAECSHDNSQTCFDHVRCDRCGWIMTDSQWGSASRKWFPSLSAAYFYKQHGRMQEEPKRYVDRADGRACEVVSISDELVTFKWAGRDTLRHLGREEFDRRFKLPGGEAIALGESGQTSGFGCCTPARQTHLVGDIPPHVRDFLGKVQGVCMGVAMSGDAHPNPDQVLMELFEEAQAILFPETNR